MCRERGVSAELHASFGDARAAYIFPECRRARDELQSLLSRWEEVFERT
jgi:hypothetical protein